MATLSVYIGESQVSILNYNSSKDYRFALYPYSYFPELFRADQNEEKFYRQVLKFLERSHQVSADPEQTIVGTVSGTKSPVKDATGVSVLEAMSTMQSYVWTLVENFSVATSETISSFYPLKKDLVFSKPVLINYLSNKSLYPQVVPSSPDTFGAEDVMTKTLASAMGETIIVEQPLLFTGGRFTSYEQNKVATYLLALDLVRHPGLFNIKIDPANKLPVIGLLNYYLSTIGVEAGKVKGKEDVNFLADSISGTSGGSAFDDEFVSLGTVLNAPGGVECLFEVESGNSQFIELKSNRLFIFPLEKGVGARIVADGKTAGHVEKKVVGGKLGFIIDTREKTGEDFLSSSSTKNSDWVKVVNERISAF